MQLINVRWYNACAHYAVTLSHALRDKGHKVIVAGDPQSPPLIKAKQAGLTVHEDLFLSYTAPWMMIYNLARMARLVKKEGIDIINAHRGESHLSAAMAKPFFKGEVPVVRTRGDVRAPRSGRLNRFLNYRLTDKIITTCDSLRTSYLRSLNMPKSSVVNVPVGIDHEHFSPREGNGEWKERLRLPEGSPVVGIVGRLSPVKGHRYFIESAAEVMRQVPQAIFVICGQDAQISAGELENMVREMCMEGCFRFAGKVKDVREIISLFDIGVVASVGSETICRVALEYMSMGKPVVGTRINAVPEVVEHGVNGLLVQSGRALELARAIVELLQDEPRRRAFGQSSRRMVVEKFTLDAFARRTEEVYLSLLN